MDIPSSFGYLLATAHQTAAEVRTIDDYDRAQMVVALRAAIATQRFGHDLMARRLAEHLCAKTSRLARHRPAAVVKPLNITVSLRVVAEHEDLPRISFIQVREIVHGRADGQRLPPVTHEDQRMLEELEQITGVSIAELAELTKKWLPNS